MGKDNSVDSMYYVLELDIDDTLRAQLYLEIAASVYAFDKYAAESLTRQALVLTGKKAVTVVGKVLQSFKANRVKALNYMGYIYESQGKLSKALRSYHNSLQLYQDLGDDVGIAQTLNNIGFVYHRQIQYQKALKYYNQSLNMEQELDNKVAMGRVLNNIGLSFKSKNQLDKALSYYRESLRISRDANDMPGIAVSLNNIGDIYREDLQKGQALEYYLKSLKVQEETGLDNIPAGFGRRNSNGQVGANNSLANTLNNIGLIYREIGKFDKALIYSKRAYELSRSEGNARIIKRATKELSILYGKKQDYNKAYYYLKLHSQMKDSLLNEETQAQITEIQQKYEGDNNEHVIAMLNAQSKRESHTNLIISGVLVLILAFITVLYTRFRIIKKQKHTIEQQELVLRIAKKDIRAHQRIISEKEYNINEGTRYARRVQQAILPSEALCSYLLKDYFILYKTKEIVSGDFYWTYGASNSKVIWMIADGKAHDVPGAFMGMISNSLLNEIVIDKHVTSPGEILDLLRVGLNNALNRGDNEQAKDGIEGIICVWDQKKETLDFAGANTSLYLYRKDVRKNAASDENMVYFGEDLVEFKTDSQTISFSGDMEQGFTTHEIRLKSNDRLYISTDGWQNQLGSTENERYGQKRLVELLNSIQDTEISSQGVRINMGIQDWQGELEQSDDICVVGVQV